MHTPERWPCLVSVDGPWLDFVVVSLACIATDHWSRVRTGKYHLHGEGGGGVSLSRSASRSRPIAGGKVGVMRILTVPSTRRQELVLEYDACQDEGGVQRHLRHPTDALPSSCA